MTLKDTLRDGIARADSAKDVQLRQVIEQLVGLNEGLESVAGSLVNVTPTRVDTALDEGTLTRLKEIADGLGQLTDANGGGGKIPKRIQVVNKVPDTIVHVLQSQFELMQGWLQPLVAAASVQRQEMAQLKQAIENSLEHYERLISKVAHAPRDG